MDDIKKLGMHLLHNLKEVELHEPTEQAAALARLSAENAELRGRLEQAEASRLAAYRDGPFMVLRKRDIEPVEAIVTDDRLLALATYERAQSNWTETYLMRVLSGPGEPLPDELYSEGLGHALRLSRERDSACAELERVQAEAAAMREENSGLRLAFARLGETLKGLKDSYVLVNDDPSKGVISSAAMYWVEDALLGCSFAEGMAADWHKLWEIKRLAREYMAAILEHGEFHHEHGQGSSEQSWNEKHEVLRKRKLDYGKALFDALGKEAAE